MRNKIPQIIIMIRLSLICPEAKMKEFSNLPKPNLIHESKRRENTDKIRL